MRFSHLVPVLLSCIALPVAAQSIPGAVPAKREPHHHLAYEDSTIRVLRVRVAAHDSTLLHEHDPDYFWIGLGASDVINARLGAPESVIHSTDLGIHYTAGNFAHVARNPGTTPFDNITVELLRAQMNVRNLCEEALANQPRNCVESSTAHASRPARSADDATGGFTGGMEHPAFSTDQLVVSLLTIEPGRTVRPEPAVRRAWIIALDTMDVRRALRIEGAGRWAGGTFHGRGAAWKLKNGGKSNVRVLAVVPQTPAKR